MKNKILSLVLAVLLVLSVVPFTAMNAQADMVYRSKTILPAKLANSFETIWYPEANSMGLDAEGNFIPKDDAANGAAGNLDFANLSITDTTFQGVDVTKIALSSGDKLEYKFTNSAYNDEVAAAKVDELVKTYGLLNFQVGSDFNVTLADASYVQVEYYYETTNAALTTAEKKIGFAINAVENDGSGWGSVGLIMASEPIQPNAWTTATIAVKDAYLARDAATETTTYADKFDACADALIVQGKILPLGANNRGNDIVFTDDDVMYIKSVKFFTYDPTVPIPSKTVYVKSDGSDSAAGTVDAPYATLDKAYAALNGVTGTIVVMDTLNNWLLETTDGAYAVNTISLQDGQVVTITGKDPATGTVYPNAAITRTRAGRTAINNGHLVLEYLTDVPFGGAWGSKFIRAEGAGCLTLGTGYNTVNPGAQVEFGAGSGDIEVNVDGAVDIVRFVDWGSYNRTGDVTINIGKNASFYNDAAAVSFGGDLSSNSVVNIDGNVFLNVDGATPTKGKILIGGYMGYTGGEKLSISGALQILLKETTMYTRFHDDAASTFETGNIYVVSVKDLPDGCDVVSTAPGYITVTTDAENDAYVNGVKVADGAIALTAENTEVTFSVAGVIPYTYYVSATGSDDNDGKTSAKPFATLDKAYASLNGATGTIVVMDELSKWLDETESAGRYVTNSLTLADGQTLTITGKDPATGSVYENAALTRNAGRVSVTNGHLVLEYITEKTSATLANDWGGMFIQARDDASLTLGTGYYTESLGTEVEFNAGTGDIELNLDGAVNVVRFVDYAGYSHTGNFTINIGKNADFYNYHAAIALGGDFGDGTAIATINGNIMINVDGATPANTKKITLGGYSSATTGKADVNGTVQILLKNTTMTAARHADAHTYEADNTYIITANNVPAGCDVVSTKPGYIKVTSDAETDAYVNGVKVEDGEIALTAENTEVSFEVAGSLPNTYYVSANGSDDNHGKTEAAPFATLDKAYAAIGTASGTIVVMDEIGHWLSEDEGNGGNQYAMNILPIVAGQTLTITGKNPVTGEIYDAVITRTDSGRVCLANGALVLEYIVDKNNWEKENKYTQVRNDAELTLGEGYVARFIDEETKEYVDKGTQIELDAGTGTPVINVYGTASVVRFVDWSNYTHTGDVTVNVFDTADFTDPNAAIALGGHFSDAASIPNGVNPVINGNIFVNVDGTTPTYSNKIFLGGYDGEMTNGTLTVNGTVQVVLKDTTMYVAEHDAMADTYSATNTYVVTAANVPEGCDVYTTEAGKIALSAPTGYKILVNDVEVAAGEYTLTEYNTVVEFEMPVSEGLYMEGVQFRVASGETEQAIRFVAAFTKDIQPQFDDALEIGMVLIPTEALGSEELVVGGTYGKYAAATCVAKKWHDADMDSYNACLTGITDNSVEYTARPYIKVSETEYVYGGTYSASVKDAAQDALDKHNAGTTVLDAEALSVVNAILGN